MLGFGLLAGAGLWAFVLLPRWVSEPPGPEASLLEAKPLPAEDPAQEMPSPPELPAASSLPESSPEPLPPPPAAPPPPSAEVSSPPPGPPSQPPTGADAFTREMSAGLAALEREAYGAARAAFLRAKEIQPSSRGALDGLTRAEAGLQLEAIGRSLEAAARLEGEEEWAAAEARYREILALDSSVTAAVRGLERSSRRARLARRLEGYLAYEKRLSSAEVLKEARETLEKARLMESAGPRLSAQRKRLGDLIEAYSRTIPVKLVSDGVTEVEIYRIGPQGTFAERSLDLRPGTYVVVGTRKGYRDVRKTLVVEADADSVSLHIRSEEKL